MYPFLGNSRAKPPDLAVKNIRFLFVPRNEYRQKIGINFDFSFTQLFFFAFACLQIWGSCLGGEILNI